MTGNDGGCHWVSLGVLFIIIEFPNKQQHRAEQSWGLSSQISPVGGPASQGCNETLRPHWGQQPASPRIVI